MNSFEQLLRQAEMAQKERDLAIQKLKEKKIKEEAEKRRVLVDQFKRPKPELSTRQVPAKSVEGHKKFTSNCGAVRRPCPSTSTAPRRPATTSAAKFVSSKPANALKAPKSRVAPANAKPSTVSKAPSNVKPRTTQPNMSFSEMMQLAQNNVNQGVSPLDRPKPPQPASPPTTALKTSSKDKHITAVQKRKLSPLTRDLPQIKRSTPTTAPSSKRMHVSQAQKRDSNASSSRFICSKDTTSKPKRYPVPKRSRYYSEDEADSMDDFIDDDDVDIEAAKELKTVVQKLCRSDETTWKKREREIDISRMENTFHGVEMEESRSARLARMEDKKEEQRGAKLL